MKVFVVYLRYHKSGDKKPGPVTHQRLRADTIDQAREMAQRHANYPGIEIIRVEETPRR